jgi:predicted phage tail protein
VRVLVGARAVEVSRVGSQMEGPRRIGEIERILGGKASGNFNMLRFLGGVFGIAILVAVFSATGGFDSDQAFSAGFAPAIGVCGASSLLGTVAGMWQCST